MWLKCCFCFIRITFFSLALLISRPSLINPNVESESQKPSSWEAIAAAHQSGYACKNTSYCKRMCVLQRQRFFIQRVKNGQLSITVASWDTQPKVRSWKPTQGFLLWNPSLNIKVQQMNRRGTKFTWGCICLTIKPTTIRWLYLGFYSKIRTKIANTNVHMTVIPHKHTMSMSVSQSNWIAWDLVSLSKSSSDCS